MKRIVTGGKRFRLLSKAGIFWAWQLSPSELSDEDKIIVFDHSYETCLKAFIQEDSLNMREDVYCHLFKEDSLLIVMDDDPTSEGLTKEPCIIAFLTCRDLFLEGKKILYLSGICVNPIYQGSGISGRLIDQAYELGEGYDAIALKTQNPVMKQCFDGCVGGKSHPMIDIELPKEVEKIGLFFADLFSAENYHPQSLVMKGMYGACLYGNIPVSRSHSYNNLFDRVDSKAGDSMLCIKTLKRFLK